ncbi:MAG: gamma-glutamyltransferase family protein [Actinomycetota bacterium]
MTTSATPAPTPDSHRPDLAADGATSLRRYPFASSRSAVLADGGMVATSQPLAAQAGLSVLADGGSAVDAAIASAAALTVVEPCSNGIGSDAFALVWAEDELHGYNGSGRWPAANSADALRAAGHDDVPDWGWVPVTVPGAVDTWAALHGRWGRLPMSRLLAPSRTYAERGFPLSPVVARQWARAAETYPSPGLTELAGWSEVFTPGGHIPDAGDRWASPGHARGLACLAENGLRDFYEGEVAAAIAEYAAATGGTLTGDDLAAHQGRWVAPISVAYRDHEVWEIPPNGQGLAALIALGIAARTDVADHGQITAEAWHRQIEAMKLGFADSDATVGDPEHGAVPVEALLDGENLDGRAALIGETAANPEPGAPAGSGTVYLCTADADGMMVSFIQSNYMGFGSGVVVPSHGISLQNRGAGFNLEPGHPNEAAPGKRPRHTIIPGFLTHRGAPVGPFGVMGGEMQPQGHLQVVAGMVDHGLNPQAALDAPRWRVERDWSVHVEAATPPEVVEGLRARGHEVEVERSRIGFGRGQIIRRLANGAYAAGSEPRADGCAMGL